MSMSHRIVGYDRRTERMEAIHPLPDRSWRYVKVIAKIGPDDPTGLYAYPLDSQQARQVFEHVEARPDLERFDYFLEPVSNDCLTPAV